MWSTRESWREGRRKRFVTLPLGRRRLLPRGRLAGRVSTATVQVLATDSDSFDHTTIAHLGLLHTMATLADYERLVTANCDNHRLCQCVEISTAESIHSSRFP